MRNGQAIHGLGWRDDPAVRNDCSERPQCFGGAQIRCGILESGASRESRDTEPANVAAAHDKQQTIAMREAIKQLAQGDS